MAALVVRGVPWTDAWGMTPDDAREAVAALDRARAAMTGMPHPAAPTTGGVA